MALTYGRIDTAWELCDAFRKMDRDYYSLEGYQAILDFFEETDCGNDTELDVIAICCDFNEESYEDIVTNYDNNEDIAECVDEDGNIDTEKLLDALNYHTWATDLGNGNILYLAW